MDKKSPNVPNLRFPGFEGEWDIVHLGDLCDKIGDGIHSTPKYNDFGDYSFINGNNFVEGKIVISESTKRVTKAEAEKHNAHTLTENTILLSINGTIGSLALYNGESVMLGKSACYINPPKTQNRLFIFYQLSANRINNYFISELTGSTIKNLSLKSIRNTILYLPANKEQKKIAKFFSFLDKRISTQSKIIEKYESLSKGIVDLLLHCENYPFKRINLGSLCSIKKGEQINTSKLLDKGIYYVMNGGITPSGYHTEYNTESGTISISEGGNSCGYVQFNFSKFWSGGHCYTLNEISSQILNEYLYFYLKSQEKSIMALRVGSGLPNIQKRDLEMIEVQYPDYIRQKEVVKTLSLLSDKIKIENSLLAVLLKQKQYLLNQMFI